MKSADIPYWRLSSFYFFYFAFLGAWVPFWNLYLVDVLHFSAQQVALISALVLITKIIGPYCWGVLADKTGKRIDIIRVGAFLAQVVFIAMFFAENFWTVFSVVLLYSFFWNAVLSQFEVVTISYLASQSHRYSQIRLWGSVGFIFAVFGLGFMFDKVDLAYLPWFLWALLIAIWLSSLFIKKPVEAAESKAFSGIKQFWKELNQPAIWLFFLACFVIQFSHGPYYTFYSIYLEQLEYSRAVIGSLWSLGVAAEIILFIFIHKLLKDFALNYLMLATLILTSIRWFLIAFFAENIFVLLFAQLFHAASFGAMHAVAIEYIKRHFSFAVIGQAQAFYSAISFGVGGALGAILSGELWQYGAELLFLVSGVSVFIVVIIFTASLKGPLKVFN